MKNTMKHASAGKAYFPPLKKRKRARAHMLNVKVDRISGLPDDLLIRVLSFLTTKEAVQTCVLSKRWRKVWAYLPILKFNVNQFVVHDSICGSDEALRKSLARFEQFVSGVVENRQSAHLDIVSYVHDTKRTKFYKVPMQWLDRVAHLMPRLIDIFIARVKSLDFPHSVFSCATLQHLKIVFHTVKKITVIPPSIYLPSLKVFDIRGAELDDKFAQKLLMGCPSLERLKLSLCDLYFSSISSNTLKELEIVGCRQYEPMQISCPSLSCLFIDSYHSGAGILLKSIKSLSTVAIRISNVAQYFGGGGDVSVQNLFTGLSNAAQLRLLCFHINSHALKVQLERAIPNCRAFNNLKTLIIIMHVISFDFNMVASLLKLSPNVKMLSLILDVNRVAIEEKQRQEVLQHKYIETVKIRDQHMRKLPQVLIKTLMRALNARVKEIGNVIIE